MDELRQTQISAGELASDGRRAPGEEGDSEAPGARESSFPPICFVGVGKVKATEYIDLLTYLNYFICE